MKDMENAREHLDRKTTECSDLSEKLKAAQNLAVASESMLAKELKEEQNGRMEIQQRLNASAKEVATTAKELASLKSQLATRSSKLDQVTKENASMKESQALLASEMQLKQVELTTMTARFSGLQTDYSELEQESELQLSRLRNELEESRREAAALSQAKQDIQDSLQMDMSELNAKYADLQREKVLLESEIVKLQDALAKDNESLRSIEASATKLRREMDKTVKSTEADKENLSRKLEESAIEIEHLKAAVVAGSDKLYHEQSKTDKLTKERDMALKMKDEFEQAAGNEREAFEVEIAQIKKNAESAQYALQSERDELNKMLAESRDKELQSESKVREIQIETAEAERKLRESVAKLESDMRAREDRAKELEHELEEASGNARSTRLELQEALDSVKRQLTSTQSEMEAMKIENENRRKEAGNMVPVTEIERLQTQVDELRAHESQIRRQATESNRLSLMMERERDALRRQLKNTVPASDLEAVKQQVSDAESERSKLQNIQRSLQEEVQAIRVERDDLVKQLIRTKLELAEMQDDSLQRTHSNQRNK
eukprot:Plantae.Rhodophyta-Purpureofilum_apyrenoidigerum.ctg4297.p1 GENE.Plantae.Rhodophyta-Purpureofilum_apyrenoidigerum.ctg4297~~Plantae.Rhodophyta-Purpureofilum_apyrenoidigerum.ctg4297.p1  ORF type:complete len:633 (+),score=188.46 Plantae.Rhodophyta-Purpureofilum_apyrenoidigerum.ctg4297:255-1901(+)